MAEDYYTTLRVHRNASQEEIHRAYRKLARKYHPDLNPDDPQAERKFEEIQAAFEVLSDPQQRAAYDCTTQSFATTRTSPENLGSSGQAFANVREHSRKFRWAAVWKWSAYVPAMIVATIIWLLAAYPLVLQVRDELLGTGDWPDADSIWTVYHFLIALCTLWYAIAMAILVYGHCDR